MRIDHHVCDGCMRRLDHLELGRFSDGKGSFFDLCDLCVKKAVMRAMKREVYFPRSACYRCKAQGVVKTTNQGWMPCPTCSQ